jgi:uncharacterized protein DUF4231
MANEDTTLQHLEAQIAWYDRASSYNQRMLKWLKAAEIVAAAVIAFSAGLRLHAVFTAGLGALIVILEGLQQLNQYQHNWMSYRSACETLKHEKYLYLAKAGPYSSSRDPHALLAERIEGLISQEHTKWISGREEAMRQKEGCNN